MSFAQADRLVNVPLSGTRIMFNKCINLRAEGIHVTELTLGAPDFPTPRYIVDACKKALDDGHTSYAENTGIPSLREAIAEKLSKENGLSYLPEEIGVTTGAAMGMFAALMSYLNPGDEVLVPDPVYLTYTSIPEIARAVVKRYGLLEEKEYQPDLDELESLVTEHTKMLVIVSPSNPTGSVIYRDVMEKLAAFAIRHDLLVITDEIYERLVYDVEHVSIASFPGMKERTILINGLSKSMSMTGFRLGYLAAPKELLEPMNRLGFYMTAGSTSFVQYAAVAALKNEDGSVERMRQEFKRRRDYLVPAINRMDLFSCAMPQGAFYVFMNIRKTGLSSQAFCDLAVDKYRLALIPGNCFGANGEGFVRLTYAASMDVLKEAVGKLQQIEKDLYERL